MVRILSAKPLSDHRLEIVFNDGVKGIFNVEPEKRGGVFLKLLDAKNFQAVTINADFGCVEWPGGIDLCPDTMHEIMTGSVSKSNSQSAMALNEDSKEFDARKGGVGNS